MKKINLGDYDKGLKVLSGVELGGAARKAYKLDERDKQGEKVGIIVPDYIYSVNSSYFSALFQKSLKTLGEKKFREQYIFECDEIIRRNIETGIFNIVHTTDDLSGDGA